jgi:hypothetical protein
MPVGFHKGTFYKHNTILRCFIMLKEGIYEQLISSFINGELDELSDDKFIEKSRIGVEESARLLTIYLNEIIEKSLENIKNQGKGLEGQVDLVIMSEISYDLKLDRIIQNSQGHLFQEVLAASLPVAFYLLFLLSACFSLPILEDQRQ